MTAYLRPTAPIAEDVLLAADPAACMALAQVVVTRPLMANHSYGLWGYSGETPAGRALTIQATGIGGPSTATVLAELASHGARRAIRIAALELNPAASAGEAERFVADGAHALDGTSRALGSGEIAHPDRALTERLIEAAGPGARAGRVWSADPGFGSAAELNGSALAARLRDRGALRGRAQATGSRRPPPSSPPARAARTSTLAPGLAELALACVAAFEVSGRAAARPEPLRGAARAREPRRQARRRGPRCPRAGRRSSAAAARAVRCRTRRRS